ncbi:MAG: hypothetical protein EOP24_46795, partial [Hyphomicrobiales bacterium]
MAGCRYARSIRGDDEPGNAVQAWSPGRQLRQIALAAVLHPHGRGCIPGGQHLRLLAPAPRQIGKPNMAAPTNSLSLSFPEILKEWDYEKNGRLRPEQVTAGSDKKVYWKCREFGHQFEAAISARTRSGTGSGGCPFCSNRKVLAGFNDLESQFPSIAEEWDFEANGALRPDEVLAGSHSKVHWKCRKFGHQWVTQIENRTRAGGSCPVCSNKQVLAGFNDLESQFPIIAEEWDFEANGALRPNQVVPGSNKEVHWKCRRFGHQWAATVDSRTNGRGCPVCTNRKVLAGFNDLESQFPIIAEEWDFEANGALRPDEVLAGSHAKVHWKCVDHGHQWEAAIKSRTGSGVGCPVCANRKVLAGFNLDAPIWTSPWVGRNGEMPCCSGRIELLTETIRPRRRASR